MNTVKFLSTDKTEKLFVQALRKNVNDYFKQRNISNKANVFMVIKTIILISSYIVPFIVLLSIPMNNWVAFFLVVLMGIGIAGVGMGVMHDACHGAYSKKMWVNNLLSGTLYLLGSNVLNWKIQHNVLHHTYTNILGLDEDIDTKGPIRLSEKSPLKKHHRYQFIYAFFFYGLMTIVRLINDFTRILRYNKAGLVSGQNKNMITEYAKMIVRKIIYFSVVFGLTLYVTNYTWYQVLIGFLIMHWVASIILSFVFQMAHIVEGAEQDFVEGADIETDWYIHQLKTTANFARDNKLLSWYVGGLNFQIEHHLFPSICHVHYPQIAIIVEQTAKEYDLPYNLQPSFTSAFISHINRLKDLGRA